MLTRITGEQYCLLSEADCMHLNSGFFWGKFTSKFRWISKTGYESVLCRFVVKWQIAVDLHFRYFCSVYIHVVHFKMIIESRPHSKQVFSITVVHSCWTYKKIIYHQKQNLLKTSNGTTLRHFPQLQQKTNLWGGFCPAVEKWFTPMHVSISFW